MERARLVGRARPGQRVPAIAAKVRLPRATVRLWLKRCNAAGLDGWREQPRAGRPPTYPAEEVGAVLAASLTDPQSLGLPVASWTLDRRTARVTPGS